MTAEIKLGVGGMDGTKILENDGVKIWGKSQAFVVAGGNNTIVTARADEISGGWCHGVEFVDPDKIITRIWLTENGDHVKVGRDEWEIFVQHTTDKIDSVSRPDIIDKRKTFLRKNVRKKTLRGE